MSTLGVYAGSFDPLTLGHIYMINEGAKLFDHLIVAIGVNPEKKPLFTTEERLSHIQAAIDEHGWRNVSAAEYTNRFLVNYAFEQKATHILRGIRNTKDAEYELGMRNINADIRPDLATVILAPPRHLCEVSSSLVKGLVGPLGWETVVDKYVSTAVFEALKAKHQEKR